LAQRLERLEASRPARGVDADAFRRAVIDRDEDRGLPLAGHGRGQAGAPHLRLLPPLACDPRRSGHQRTERGVKAKRISYQVPTTIPF
jgi:hypothetical protein